MSLLWFFPWMIHCFPSDPVPPKGECTGTCQTATLPSSYQTPPSREFCKNTKVKGPTPCWFPSCVINEEAHGINDGW